MPDTVHPPRSNNAAMCEDCGAAIAATAAEGLCGACLVKSFGLEAPGERTAPEPGGVLRFFGDYELLEEVARGGMGVVYRARQVSLNRTVAVKLLASSGDGSMSFAERFKVEAEAAAGLDHPHIIPVYEFGQYGEQPFLAMRYIPDGRSLSGAKVSARAAAEIMVKTAQAMHYAHQRGVLHRDLKPANILLDETGEPFVSDFGLAKLMEADTGLTRSVEMMGTPAYMPPEQASGKLSLVTTAADVYGLGAVFYELLTGRPPFTGESGLEIIRKVTDEPPARPSSIVKSLDRDLETICLKCLEKEPPKRFASALALADDLQRWLRHEPIHARPAGSLERLWKWARRHPAIAAVSAISLLAVTVIAVGATLFSLRLQKSAEENRQQIIGLHQLSAEQMVEDGDAFTGLLHLTEAIRLEERDAPGSARVLRSYFQSIVRQSPSPELVWFHDAAQLDAAFSGDGSHAATGGADGGVRLYDAASGALRHTMKHSGAVSRVMFNAGGTRVLCFGDESLSVWDTQTGAPAGALPKICRGAVFHPDGTRGLVLTRYSALECSAEDGAVLRMLVMLPAHGGAYPPDGKRLALSVEKAAGQHCIQLLDGLSGAMLAESPPEQFALRELAFSPDGRLFMARSEVPTGQRGLRRLLVWKTDALSEPPVIFRDGVHHSSAASFDAAGTRIIHAGTSGNAAFLDPHRLETRGVQFLDPGTMLTESILPLGHPATVAAWSAGDQHLVTATVAGAVRLWNPALLETKPPALWHSGAVLAARFSPGGDRLLTASADGTLRLYRLPHDGGAAAAIPHHQGDQRSDIVSLGVAGPDEMFSFSRAGILRRWHARDGRMLSEQAHFSSHPDPFFVPGRKTLLLTKGQRVTEVSVAGGSVSGSAQTSEQFASILFLTGAGNAPLVAVSGRRRGGDGSAAFAAGVYDSGTGQPACPPLPHPAEVRALTFSPDARQLLTGCLDGRARVWNVADGTPARELPHAAGVITVAWSGDGRSLLTGTGLGNNTRHSAQLWRTGDTPVWQVWRDSSITHAIFSLDGAFVALSSADGEVTLHHAATGMLTGAPLRLQSRPNAIAFSPDSRSLGIAGNGLQPCLLDTQTGRQLAIAMLHPMPLRTVAFSAGSRTFATGSNDSFVRLWPMDGATDDIGELQQTAEMLSNQTLDGNTLRRLTAEELRGRTAPR